MATPQTKEEHLMAEEWGKIDLLCRFHLEVLLYAFDRDRGEYKESQAMRNAVEQMRDEPLPHCRYREYLEAKSNLMAQG